MKNHESPKNHPVFKNRFPKDLFSPKLEEILKKPFPSLTKEDWSEIIQSRKSNKGNYYWATSNDQQKIEMIAAHEKQYIEWFDSLSLKELKEIFPDEHGNE